MTISLKNRLTIWTAVTMTDIVYDEKSGTGIACSALNVTQTIGNGTGTRTITTADTGWMLGAGWLFYLASFLLNLLYYKLHPSGPEFCSWGKEEELEEWTPPEEDGEPLLHNRRKKNLEMALIKQIEANDEYKR